MGSTRRSFLHQTLLGGSWVLWGSAARSIHASTTDPAFFLAAVRAGDLSAISHQLDKTPALLTARDEHGRSAYAVALLAGQQPAAELLAQRGHSSDLHEAALAGDWPRFEALAQATPEGLHRPHPVAGTAMIAAAIGGAGGSIWRVYRYGGDPNQFTSGRSPFSALGAALRHPSPLLAEQTAASLLADGADPNPPCEKGVSPLHRAATRGFDDLVEMLIRRGAHVGSRSAAGDTPRDAAERAGQTGAASVLAAHQEIPRDDFSTDAAYDVDGKPFRAGSFGPEDLLAVHEMVGVAHGPLEGVEGLLRARPELAKAVGTSEEGAVEAAAHMGRLDSVEELLGHGAAYSLPTATMRGDAKRVRELLAEDPRRINARGPHDFALLWYPVIGGGSLEMTELLLDAGAEVERQHSRGTTALHWAARAGHLDLAAFLVEHGADPKRRGRFFDPSGATPAEVAEAAGREKLGLYLRQVGSRG